MAFSPNGTRLASASSYNTVKVWDTVTGQETLTLEIGGMWGENSVAFSPDGKRLASARKDGTVKVWDARAWTPKLKAQFEARGVLTFRCGRAASFEELRESIRSDKNLRQAVRQQALDWAELFWKNAQKDRPSE